MWLTRLHAFARAFVLAEVGADRDQFDAAKKHVASQQRFLLVFWTVASAYVIIPAILMSLCIAGKVSLSPEVQAMSLGGEPLFPPGDQADLHRMNMICTAGIPILSVLIFAYSCLGIVYGAVGETAPGRLATKAFLDFIRHFLPLMLLTLVVSAINLFLLSPFAAANWIFPKAQLDANLAFQSIMQLWLGATSTFIWPLSVAPFCMIMADESRK
jgi:hypothetical protein